MDIIGCRLLGIAMDVNNDFIYDQEKFMDLYNCVPPQYFITSQVVYKT